MAHGLSDGSNALLNILRTRSPLSKTELWAHPVYRAARERGTKPRNMSMQLAQLRRRGLIQMLDNYGETWGPVPDETAMVVSTAEADRAAVRAMQIEVKVGSAMAFIVGGVRVEVRAVP